MIRFLLAFVALTVSATSLADEPIYRLSYEIVHAEETLASPVELLRSGKTGSIVIGATRDTLLEIYCSATELGNRIDISAEVFFEGTEQKFQGTVQSSDVIKLGFDDLKILLTVEEWTDGAT